MWVVKEKAVSIIKGIDKQIIFITVVITLVIAYYINPLTNVDLTEWNRTFCSAIISGISIDKRINNFYKLFFLYLPLIFILLTCVCSCVLGYRRTYKDSFTKICMMTLFSVVASYISRYTSGESEIKGNALIQSILSFLIVLLIITIIDYKEMFSFSDVTTLFVAFMIAVISFNILFGTEIHTSILISGVLAIVYSVLVLCAPFGKQIYINAKNIIYILMWFPVVIRFALEIIYYYAERGQIIENYYIYICAISVLFVALTIVIVPLLKSKKGEKDFTSLGYIGALTSMGAIGCFAYSYQYVWSYSYYSNLYEFGNRTVAMDSVLYGKLPIVEYFSAHALTDVWTKIIYCLIHRDINGMFVDPYAGLATILAFGILFYIVKMLFDKDVAILFICLFPGNVTGELGSGIKFTSLCCISVAMMVYILKKPGIKQYVLFWLAVLISVFTTYDEGMALGVACILAYLFIVLVQKQWKYLKLYIICGVSVGIGTLSLYVIYGRVMGIPIISRIKEWISLSAGASSSWATSNFGDVSSFAFLISYFVVPVTAIAILVLTVYNFLKKKEKGIFAIVTIVFALAELLYIPRTIVYHNLAVCSGSTGVLFNFIHWTVSSYVLYSMSLQNKAENKKIFAWGGVLLLVIVAEGALVTKNLPTTSSALLARGITASEDWDLVDNMTENWNQDRIVFDDDTMALINQFRTVFDTLLSDDETFLDFANITSMYALTDRVRPCYVGQSPSLLTDLYSQECFLEEIVEYDCPLVVVGTTETSYLQQMVGIPHNVRYYKIAEYIYAQYRPLLRFGEFAIWCEKESYDSYCVKLSENGFEKTGYDIVDYGYDMTSTYVDENGNLQYDFAPYHSYGLGMIPYIWANYDDYNAIENEEIISLDAQSENYYVFDGSQSVLCDAGNYLVFECTNNTQDDLSISVIFLDSANEGAIFQYSFTAIPGNEQYMIRTSQDYFWDIYNIDRVAYVGDSDFVISDVRILEGD